MKAFFIASIRGKQDHIEAYNEIIRTMEGKGYSVIHKHVTGVEQQEVDDWTPNKKLEFHQKIISQIKSSDIVVAEVSSQSINVGFLVSLAVDFNKPTIVLYTNKVDPNAIKAIKTDKIKIVKYLTSGDIETLLTRALNEASGKVDIRFNFFISPEINDYLDWISRVKRIPRAVYLRELVEKELAKNKEYKTA